MQVWYSNRRAKNRRHSTDKHGKLKKSIKTSSNGCPANSTGEDTNSSGSPLSNNSVTNGTNLTEDKSFISANISSINQTVSTLNHDNLNSTNLTSNALNSNALDTNPLTNDFNRANNTSLISLAARINSGFNSFYPGLHSDTYG